MKRQSATIVIVGLLLLAGAVQAAFAANTLSLGSGSGPAGETVQIPLGLDNEDPTKGLQADILFDGGVASLTGLALAVRGTGFQYEIATISSGHARVILYYTDSTILAAGTGTLANLNFELLGAGGTQTNLTPSAMVLSDPDGAALPIDGEAGTLQIDDPIGVPTLQVTALRNPGHPRYLTVVVKVSGGSGNAPTVTASGASVPMTSLTTGVWNGTYTVADGTSSVTVTANDSNINGAGTGQVTVTFD